MFDWLQTHGNTDCRKSSKKGALFFKNDISSIFNFLASKSDTTTYLAYKVSSIVGVHSTFLTVVEPALKVYRVAAAAAGRQVMHARKNLPTKFVADNLRRDFPPPSGYHWRHSVRFYFAVLNRPYTLNLWWEWSFKSSLCKVPLNRKWGKAKYL